MVASPESMDSHQVYSEGAGVVQVLGPSEWLWGQAVGSAAGAVGPGEGLWWGRWRTRLRSLPAVPPVMLLQQLSGKAPSKPAFPSPTLIVSSGHWQIIKRRLKLLLCSIHLDFHDGKQGDLFRDCSFSYEVEQTTAASSWGALVILLKDQRYVQPWALEAYLEKFYLPGNLEESKSHFILSCDA